MGNFLEMWLFSAKLHRPQTTLDDVVVVAMRHSVPIFGEKLVVMLQATYILR